MGKDLTEVRSLQRKLTPDKRYVGLDSRERTSLQGIAKRAQACKSTRFQNLYGMIDEGMLLESWRRLNKKAAKGVDGITAQAYEKDLYEFALWEYRHWKISWYSTAVPEY